MKLLIDKSYKVYVKVDYNVHKFFRKLKIDRNGLREDIEGHLLFGQYKPWDERDKFVGFVKEMISKWSIKKNYGKLDIKCFKDDAPIYDNGMTYTFKVNLGINEECVIFVDVIVNYRSTWMQNMMMDCDKSLRGLIESILFTDLDGKDMKKWLDDVKYSMGYIPGREYSEYGWKSCLFTEDRIHFVLNDKLCKMYIVDYRRDVNNGYGYVYEIGSKRTSYDSVDTFMKLNILKDLGVYTFIDDYFGNMFIEIYKNGKKEK